MGLLKRNSKSTIAIILSASMVVGSMGISFAASFSDVNNHWAANQIKSLVNKGVVSGYSDGTFKPDNHITRAEFISLINKAFNLKLVYDINYKDVSSKDWFYEDLRKAKAKGYISGYEDNTIRPNNKITRQEVAVIMAKVLNKQYDNKGYVCENFKDSDKIADWSKKSIGSLVDSKNMSGYPDGTFGPEKYITRAEAVTVIYKKFKGSGFSSSSSSSSYSSKDDKKSKNKDEDVVIDDKGDRLKNKTIDGDLTISSDVGDGEVYLEDVTVKGTTYIYGGGEKSIYLEDCDLGKVVVDKKDDKVRLVAQGSTTIDTVTLKSGAILEEDSSGSDKLTKSGFDDVSVEDDHKVTLKGEFDDVYIEVEDADLYLEEGEISKVSIKDDAEDAYIYVARNTKINTIDADERAKVSGSGDVRKIEGSKSSSVSRTSSSSSSSSSSHNSAPVASSVSITGTARVGEILTGNYTFTDSEGNAEGTSTFRWLVNNGVGDSFVAIAGATSKTYVVDKTLEGRTIKFEVTPKASSGTTTGTARQSSATVAVQASGVAESVPTNLATGLTFTDGDNKENKISGDVTITKAADDSDVESYKVYYLDASNAKVGDAIGTVAKDKTELKVTIVADTDLPAGATQLGVYSVNAGGESADCTKTVLTDDKSFVVLPTNLATGLTFTDGDNKENKISGDVTITKAADDSDVESYKVYYLDASNVKVGDAIGTVAKDKTELKVTIAADTDLPAGATQLGVYSVNAGGESVDCTKTALTDNKSVL
ncbi:S-layer homology domain-containing protein [Tepidibacter mesophilus]|uniref:S-layer homology domain-containing protein n=1 Tax=Tepidibacter mesophilus TaxID=655607 RepID=UPI000C0882F2|nr:S-layer homology domain-containing protein [Tepidibacter mesophilus]